MCDYSLQGISNRLAVEGEQLQLHRFHTGTLGLAAPAELRALAEKQRRQTGTRFWSAIKSWMSFDCEESARAVCIPPGAQLLLQDIAPRLQRELGVGAIEVVTFTQLGAEAYNYRDAVRFHNGREVLLQRLEVGQRVGVLCLSLADEALKQEWPVAVGRERR
jgi:hypothetical protein